MERYLQILVITLPALAVGMGGLLVIVFLCLRSWKKARPNIPVRQCSVNTQFDGSLQMTQEIRDKLVEEAMARVKMYLSEDFRKKQATKISQEEFNKLYRKQRGLDSEDSIDRTDERRKRQEIMESVCRIPGIAPLTYAITTQDSSSLKKTDSFATLWVEELQRSGEAKPYNRRGSEQPGNEQTIEPLPPEQSIVACRDFSAAGVDSVADQDFVFTQLGFNKAPAAMNQAKSWNELKLLNDLEMFLLTASSNLCRSIMAFSMDYNPGSGITLSSSKEICMMPSQDLELGSHELVSVASTSASMNAPQLLKGGAPNENNFVWRLDIEEKDVEPSPPNTPVRHRSPSHLCRGVQFQVADHPPALSLIDLDPELGYGWRGPDWRETFGRHHIYREREGPSIYRKKRLKQASDPCVAQYYKSVEVEAKKRWENVQDRYRRAQQLAALKVQIREDIRRSAEWRKHLRENAFSETDSSRNSSEIEAEEQRRAKNGEQDEHRVRSMLSTSSSSTLDSDEATRPRIDEQLQCLRKHRHCTFENPQTSRSNH